MRPNKITSIIIEGIDRIGKDTVIQNLLHEYGYHQVVHFEKPKRLKVYGEYETGLTKLDKVAAFRYQQESFLNMFKMMSSNARFIFNRAHLGEVVYSPLYRGYHGNYVFELEQEFIAKNGLFPGNTMLILLHALDLKVITDDGQSFNAENKVEEQALFRQAFNDSLLPNKAMISVTYHPDQRGGFRAEDDILQDVINAIYKADNQ